MKIFKSYTLAAGLALFSMFFGAGNVTFPLIVGHVAGSENWIAMSGLFLTAVLMPVIGLISMILFDCDYVAFFSRLGRIPGIILIILSIALIGPFLGISRTATVAFATVDYKLLDIPIWVFSALFFATVYLCTFRKNRIVDIIGVVLTPALIMLILTVVVLGLLNPMPVVQVHTPASQMFWYGLVEGYHTLDLVASLFFSSVILYSIKEHLPESVKNNKQLLLRDCIKAGLIGGTILGLVYLGISHVSAMYANSIDFDQTEKAQLLAALLDQILGGPATYVSATIVTLACFTTAVGLAAVTADLICTLTKEKIALPYQPVLIAILVLSFFDSLLGFTGLMNLVAPLIILCYPVYIALSLCNGAYKLFHFKMIKTPATILFVASLGAYFWH